MLKFFVHALLWSAILASPLVLMARNMYQPDAVWYQEQKMSPQAQARLGVFHSFCRDAGDPVRTRFRIAKGGEAGAESYQYWKDGEWKPVPADIVEQGDAGRQAGAVRQPARRPRAVLHRRQAAGGRGE